jgi:Glycosyltransferase family 9 (heptosyltransferase)
VKILLPDPNIRGIKTMKNKEAELAPGFTRPGTMIHPYRIGYVIYGGGAGDFICYTRALEWIAENLPHIYGTVYYPEFLVQFAKHIFRNHPHWKVEPNEQCIPPDWNPGFPFLDPFRNGRTQFITGHGAHPIDLGFMYYANMTPVPEAYNNSPELDFVSDGLPKKLEPRKYAVFTPAATVESRTVPGHFYNPLIDHVKKLGLIPVVIGKKEVAKNYHASISGGLNMDGVVDLFDQTTILEAAQILQYSAVTIGLDNGLLHLASCTDCPIVFGYNVVAPEYRRPRRRSGKTIDVFISREEAEQKKCRCIGCLTLVKGYYNHSFDNCMYKFMDNLPHPKCIDILFSDNGKRWIAAIDKALESA